MRESLGNSLLMYLVILFSGIVILFFVGILSYSKAYRVKNRIVEIIEKYGSYATAKTEIDNNLKEAGYKVAGRDLCSSNRVQNHLKNDVGLVVVSGTTISSLNDPTTGYNYCVFEASSKTTDASSKYYIVVTFVHFDIPVIGDTINLPIYGETKILGKVYNY